MNFYDEIMAMDLPRLRERITGGTARDVERVLSQGPVSAADIPLLLSEAAVPYLEIMAQRAAAMTERRFGKVIQLYTPLYFSNTCINKCAYCGFNHDLDVHRITLTPDQTVTEAQILYEQGFRHILLVCGESRRDVPLEYLLEIIQRLHGQFDSISVEIHPQSKEEYQALSQAGLDGLTIFQETYDPERYGEFHLGGPKRIYKNRLDAMDHGGEAGLRSLGLGALLGLTDWRFEATMVALHARHLQRRFWQSKVAVNFPRIRAAASGYQPKVIVTDRDLVQMICAMRLILPDAELVMSTREPAALRDHLIGLGITRLSAGSRTNPGGYSHPDDDSGKQFNVSDPRSAEEMTRVIEAKGFEPVWKDFDRQFIAAE